MHMPRAIIAVFVLLVTTNAAGQGRAAVATTIPLCQGLTIVTAVNQSDGDYESIKTIESVSDAGVRLKYSVERLVDDMFSNDPPKLVKGTVYRTIRREDLTSAKLYQQQFSGELPETIPETTAIGTSAAILKTLKSTGEAEMGIFIAYSQPKPSLDRNVHPNVYDNQMVTRIARVGTQPVMMPVIVNDVRVELPTIHARGDFFGDKSEFFFLDDERNPLALRFRIGIDAFKSGAGGFAGILGTKVPPDRDTLQVIKITHRCDTAAGMRTGGPGSGAGQPPGGQGQASGGASALEQALATTGKVDIYSIYFSFNSDVIREESEPTLKEIADILRRHPGWRLAVNGHTDGIGGDQANLALSQRRSTSVKDALAKRYNVAPNRLTTTGFGKAQPKDTNDTLDGRARNRRVELVRIP
jgi:outer membrane protein OmpA-like peptidoglycan-associated protein